MKIKKDPKKYLEVLKIILNTSFLLKEYEHAYRITYINRTAFLFIYM